MSTMQHPRWQVFTDEPIARYMATQVATLSPPQRPIRILDPGSGPGTLLESLLEVLSPDLDKTIEAVAVESDPLLAHDSSMLNCPAGVSLKVYNEDFFEYYRNSAPGFSHVIMNPPYGRPEKGSGEQRTLRDLKLPAHNWYAAFVIAAFNLLRDDGVLISIVPRSILTGAMAAPLRRQILSEGRLELVTTFADRKLAFTRDDVQQDVVIIAVRKASGSRPKEHKVRVGRVTSVDPWECEESVHSYGSIVRSIDDSPYILAPGGGPEELGQHPVLTAGLKVATGQVVDFRLREYIDDERSDVAVPLIDARRRQGTQRYLRLTPETFRFAYAPGTYVTLDRFSPPEQAPRARVRLIDASRERGVAFENHVNVIHRDGGPLGASEAAGLVKLFEQQSIDRQLAQLSSSTHVNAVDIRRLRRP